MTEYEIKLLGTQASLVEVFKRFTLCTQPHRTRHYSFNTYYFDYNQQFTDAGFSLRHRTGVWEIGKDSGTELKAQEGNIGNISARLELGVRGPCVRSNYQGLVGLHDYPETAPRVNPDALSIVFATGVRRLEHQIKFRLPEGEYIIEAALDDIGYLHPHGPRGSDLYDVILMPSHGEHELEFEIKETSNLINKTVLKKISAWLDCNCLTRDVEVTTQSKALRARRFELAL